MLVLVLAAVYWIAYRPLPKTSGQITAPISARATVARDALGVPHIAAGQLGRRDFPARLRHGAGSLVADGCAAPAGGRRVVRSSRPIDARVGSRSAPACGCGASPKQEPARWPPADRAVLAAYARGVNYFIETHRGRAAARIHAAALRSAALDALRTACCAACRCIAP